MGGGGKGSTTKSSSAPPPEIMEAYKKSLGMAQQVVGQPYQQYTAPLVAGMNQNQQQAISNVKNAQGMALPFIQQGAQYTNQAAQGVNPGMINQFMSPYLNNVVGATQRNLLESNAQQQAAMKAGSIQSGAFGGDRAKYGLSELARQQGLAGGQVIGGLMNQGYGQALGAAQNQIGNMMMGGQQLAGMGTAAQQSALGGAQALMAAGTQQQSTEQAGLQAAYDQFLQRQAYPYQQAQFYANIAQGIGAGAGGSSSTTQPGPSPFSQVLGFGTAMAGLPWSDERLKENVKKVGQTKDGQGIYTYNFKGNPKTEMGLLAQEVEKKHPDAVHEINGLKMVDYDAATEGSRTGKAGGGASMGGLVAPGMERQAFAAGGFGAIPYADFMKGLSYIPATDMSGAKPGSTLPSDWSTPPKPFEDPGLDPMFAQLEGMTEEQKEIFVKNMKGLGGVTPPSTDDFRAPPASGGMFGGLSKIFGFADGGLVNGRHGYQTDGAVTETEAPPTGIIPPKNYFDRSADRTLEFEGGLLEADTNGTPTNYGINQASHPDIDVRQIGPDDAKAIYKAQYWDAINGDQLAAENPNLAHVAFDTAIIAGAPRAKKMLEASGGDPVKYMELRSSFLNDLVQQNPEKYGPFARSWENRNNALMADISGDGAPADAGLAGAAPPEGMEDPSATTGVVPAASSDIAEDQGVAGGPTSLFERVTGKRISTPARMGLLAAGLGMMAGRSPFAAVNIGQGGVAGMNAYLGNVNKSMEAAKLGAEAGKTVAETTSVQNQTRLALQAAWMNFNMIRIKAGKGPITFEEYMKTIGLQSGPSGSQPSAGAADLGGPAATDTGTGGAPSGTVAGEAAPAATDQAPTDDFQTGGNPEKVGTMNYWQERMRRAQDSLVYATPEKVPGITQEISLAQDALEKIQANPFYVASQNMAQNYDIAKTNLMRLGELNGSFMGGRGSKNVADVIGIAEKLGIQSILPEGWQDDDEKYDEALKLATEIAIRDAQQSGLLKAPGAALEAEERTVPVPDMAPEARYNLVKKSLAILERNNDLYAGWDTSPDTASYIRQFTSDPAHAMENYVKRAEALLPPPATSGPRQAAPDVIQQLNSRFPDASENDVVTGRNGEKLKKSGNTWVVVQ